MFRRSTTFIAFLIISNAAQNLAATFDPHLCANLGLVDTPLPLQQFKLHLSGFHGQSDDMSKQMIAEHYCSDLSPDLTQCVVFDSAKSNAKAQGIEYLISPEAFKALPAAEKQYWHTHKYEYLSGTLVIPEATNLAKEARDLKRVASMYGRTFSLWETQDAVPMGPPLLLMSFLKDGQLDPALVAKRDADLEIATKPRRQARARYANEILSMTPISGADQWFNRPDSLAPQTILAQVKLRGDIRRGSPARFPSLNEALGAVNENSNARSSESTNVPSEESNIAPTSA